MRFKEYWLKGNPGYGFDINTPVTIIDDIIHKERIAKDRSKVTYTASITSLPNGSFIMYNNMPYLIYDKQLYAWSAAGYSAPIALTTMKDVTVLTPLSFVNMFSAGYTAQVAIGQ